MNNQKLFLFALFCCVAMQSGMAMEWEVSDAAEREEGYLDDLALCDTNELLKEHLFNKHNPLFTFALANTMVDAAQQAKEKKLTEAPQPLPLLLSDSAIDAANQATDSDK